MQPSENLLQLRDVQRQSRQAHDEPREAPRPHPLRRLRAVHASIVLSMNTMLKEVPTAPAARTLSAVSAPSILRLVEPVHRRRPAGLAVDVVPVPKMTTGPAQGSNCSLLLATLEAGIVDGVLIKDHRDHLVVKLAVGTLQCPGRWRGPLAIQRTSP